MYFYKKFFILTKISFYQNMCPTDFVIIRTTHITPPLHARTAADGPRIPDRAEPLRPAAHTQQPGMRLAFTAAGNLVRKQHPHPDKKLICEKL